jgi:hypothetical protein
MAVSFSGSLDISGSLTTTGTIIMSGSIASASFAQNATTASNANTSSYVVSSQTDETQNTRLTTIEAVTGSYASTSSLSLTSASVAAINVKTGSYATTGSNYFIGTQVITGSVYIANDLIVQGSSSLQNITASAVSVGTNTIILNTATPILQFGGISVFDSGSTMGRSGSLLWNSINDHWINVNPSGSDEGYNSAMVINGPKNTGSLGSEVGLTTNYIPVSQGEDHITDSIIFQSGSINIGIGTTVPAAKLDVSGTGRFNSGTSNIPLQIISSNSNGTILGLTNTNGGPYIWGINAYSNGTLFFQYGTLGAGSNPFYVTSTGAATFASSVTATNGFFNGFATNGTPSSTGTSANFLQFRNTGGDFYIGQEGSTAGGFFTGASAYASVLYSVTAQEFIIGGTRRLQIAGSGAATFSSSVTVATFLRASSGAQSNPTGGASVAIDYQTTNDGQGRIRSRDWDAAAWRNLTIEANNIILTPAGNVGIGTTSPKGKFDVYRAAGDSGTAAIVISNGEGGGGRNWSINTEVVAAGDFGICQSTTNGGTPSPTAANTKFLINAAGNVGIGTTSPTSILNVVSSVNNNIVSPEDQVRVINTFNGGVATIGFSTNSGGNQDGRAGIVAGKDPVSGVTGFLALVVRKDAGTWLEGMRITSSGTVYINTTSNPLPDNAVPQLGIIAAASTDAVNIKHLQNGNNSLNIWQTGTTQHNAIAFYKGDAQSNRGNIVVTTSGTSYNTVSDYRLKENVVPIQNGIDRLMQLKPSKFNWIETGEEAEGFIAHELQEVFPDAVTGEKDAVYSSTGNIKPQSVDYGRITPLLVKALQELKAELNTANQKIAALESRQ